MKSDAQHSLFASSKEAEAAANYAILLVARNIFQIDDPTLPLRPEGAQT